MSLRNAQVMRCSMHLCKVVTWVHEQKALLYSERINRQSKLSTGTEMFSNSQSHGFAESLSYAWPGEEAIWPLKDL
jgi:hypothetical protein